MSSSKPWTDSTIALFSESQINKQYSFLQGSACDIYVVTSWGMILASIDYQFLEMASFWKAEHYYLQIFLLEYFKYMVTNTQQLLQELQIYVPKMWKNFSSE